MTKIYITYESNETTLHDDFGVDGPWEGSYHKKHDWQLGQVFLSQPKSCYYEEFEIEGKRLPKQVYVVYVRYSTGNTFGREDGCGHIVGAYKTRTEAETVYKSIEDGTYGKPKQKKGRKAKEYFYLPWEGYFERFEGVYLEILLV